MGECILLGKSKENIKAQLPEFTYTGTWQWKEQVKNGSVMNWQLDLLTSGKLTFTKVIKEVDVFLLGGGGAGAKPSSGSGGAASGGGGYYTTAEDIAITKGTTYDIVIGAGGDTNGEAGGQTKAFNKTANGGGGAKAGSASYALVSCCSSSGSGGNLYKYGSLSSTAKTSLGSGYHDVYLKYPYATTTHSSGFTVYLGTDEYWYRTNEVYFTVKQIYNTNGTNGTGAGSTYVFGNSSYTVSGAGATSAASRLGQGGGSSTITAGNGLVSIRNPR